MKKSRVIASLLLGAFICISALPLVAAPTAPVEESKKSRFHIIENGEEHCSQWLIRAISDSEEINSRHAIDEWRLVDFNASVVVSTLIQVRYSQVREQHLLKIPKRRIYLANSVFLI